MSVMHAVRKKDKKEKLHNGENVLLMRLKLGVMFFFKNVSAQFSKITY